MAILKQTGTKKTTCQKWQHLKSGRKLHEKLGSRLLAGLLCATMILLGGPETIFADNTEPTTFVTAAYANHWGRSDLRSYLNGTEKNNETLPLSTCTDEHIKQAPGYYGSQFSDAENEMIIPFTYYTNIVDDNGNVTSSYETTDKFYLPSGNKITKNISWGKDDINSKNRYSATAAEKARIIPISYWTYGAQNTSWLRSSGYSSDKALTAQRGSSVEKADVDNNNGFSPVFKIDISDIDFASAASASAIMNAGGSMKIVIPGSSDFGKATENSLPDYGMYIKIKTGDIQFNTKSLSLNDNTLTVEYSTRNINQNKDRYVVVQAFTEDSLTEGTTSYVAAKKLVLNSESNSMQIDVSGWKESNGQMPNLDDFSFRIWLEEEGSGTLSIATSADKFVYKDDIFYMLSKYQDLFSNYEKAKNSRVYAERDELKASWGDLNGLSDEDYNKVISGNTASETGGVTGIEPSNQKIYFGIDSSGAPLQFWIAGREKIETSGNIVNSGNIDPSGMIMTLYQAKATEVKPFNASKSDYIGDSIKVDLMLQSSDESASTNGIIAYPTSEITVRVSGDPNTNTIPKDTLIWQHRISDTDSWLDGMPTRPGFYKIRCYAESNEDFERTYSNSVTFKVTGIPISSDFNFIGSDPRYDGKEHPLTLVEYGDKYYETPYLKLPEGLSKERVTVKYYDSTGEQLSGVPKNAGSYTVKIAVANGDIFTASTTDLTDVAWKYSIGSVDPYYMRRSLTATYGDTLKSLNEQLGKPTGLNQMEISGTWTWSDGDDTTVGDVGTKTFAARFTPDDQNNYNWTTIVGWSGSKGYFEVRFVTNVTKAKPKLSDQEISAYCGQNLNSLQAQIKNPTDKSGRKIEGSWSFKDEDNNQVKGDTVLNDIGEYHYKATFNPSDTANYEPVEIALKITVSADTSTWGSAEARTDGKTQYVDNKGKTSIEINSDNIDENGIIWLEAGSDGSEAWYGLGLSENAFDLNKGLRLFVQQLSPNDADYDTYYSQLDATRKAEVEGNNGILFLIGVEDYDSKTVQPKNPVKVYVQIGDDWDLEDLQACCITAGEDESVPVTSVENFSCPVRRDEFGVMTLSHFSPCFIYDQLTSEEKAQLEAAAKESDSQQNEKSEENSSSSAPKTGDKIIYFAISGLGSMMTLALGLMLNSKISRKKLDK